MSDDSGDTGLGGFDSEAFIKQFDPNVHIASPEEVRQTAQKRSRNVIDSYNTLRNILIRHEETIQKRWAKKTRPQRQKILLDAWPGMVASHRPDFEAFRRTNRANQPLSGGQYREHYMWPHINQEDLLKPRTLLLLLNARGRNPPSDFAGADYDAMRLGLVSRNLLPVFLNLYTIILHGAYDVAEYGKLISWDDDDDAMEWAMNRKQFIPGEALFVLEAQEKLNQFLVECCRQILHDIPADRLTADAYSIQPEPRLKTEKESSGFDSLAVMAAEAPYRLPSKLDIRRIESVLGAQASAAEDHLWALREDPAYFAEQLFELREHRQEILKDTRGNDHPTLKTVDHNTFWARLCSSISFQAYMRLELFTELQRQANELQQLHIKYADSLSPMSDLPDELLDALLKFQHYLGQASKGPLNQLRDHVVASPPWRKYFVRQVPPNTTTSIIGTRSKPGMEMSDIENRVLWILRTMWEDGHELFLIRLPLLVDELGRMIETETGAKELFSAFISDILGDLTIISHCLTQVELFLPWSRTFETALVDRADDIKAEYSRRFEQWPLVMDTLKDKNVVQFAQLGNPSDGRFTYPFEKRRTKQNVEALQRAERHLDEFWAAIDRLVYSKCGKLENTAVRRVLSQPRIMQRTADWVDPAPSKSNQTGRESAVHPDLVNLYKPLSTIYIGGQGTDNHGAQPTASKSKAKSKDLSNRVTTSQTTVIADTEQELGPEPELASIPVDARSFKVFRTLFFNPAVTSSPGEVSWNDFLHAMTSTGLFAAEKLYGSVWQFQKLVGGDQSRIQFHEPHPRGKIPFTTARRHGRRLNRAFGWAGDMFVLKDK